MKRNVFRFVFALHLVVFGAAQSFAGFAAGLAPNGLAPLPTGPFSGHPHPGFPDDSMANVFAPASHLTATPNPWTKTFRWNYAGVGVSPGAMLCIMEQIPLIYPAGTPPAQQMQISDWHEQIVNVQFGLNVSWSSTVTVTANGNTVPSTITGAGTSTLDINFNPLTIPVNTGTTSPLVLRINKYLRYNGPGTITPGGNPNPFFDITVSEYPTTPNPPTTADGPEPTSFLVWGLLTAIVSCVRYRPDAA
jgi:hypothetical protein